MEQRKALLFVCPKLLNLETVFKASKIFADTSALPKPKIKRYRRHDEVWVKCPLKPSEVTLKFENLILGVKPSSQNHEFDGKNVIMTKSKTMNLFGFQIGFPIMFTLNLLPPLLSLTTVLIPIQSLTCNAP